MLSTWFHRDRDYVSHPFTLVLMFAVIRREPSSEAKVWGLFTVVWGLFTGGWTLTKKLDGNGCTKKCHQSEYSVPSRFLPFG